MSIEEPKQENPWISLLVNILIPVVLLSKSEYLGAEPTLLVALSFPLVYGIYDFYRRRKFNFISALGFISVLFKGGLGLMKADSIWFAVNEAALPGLLGIATLVTAKSKRPLVKMFLLNDSVVHVDRIHEKLQKNNKEQEFEFTLRQSTYLLFISFILSSILNFFFAYYIIKSPTGTEAFNKELGYMQAISFPVIMLSCSSIMVYALWKLVKQLKVLTGLEFEEIFKGAKK